MLKSVVAMLILLSFTACFLPYTIMAEYNGWVEVNGRVQVFDYNGTYCYSYHSVWGYPDTTTPHYDKWHKGKPLPPGNIWDRHHDGHGAVRTRTRFATSTVTYLECPGGS